ncbi:MAG: short-chain dehydrogenase [Rhodospirillaceae bacterium TMED8]|nr:short-chain dehydrogenase [Magnetovibrio sp.]OUT50119.1 MAG: short-chain dehydrogenase [Rhodospirillaceae bacterium TMED8]|tara:strand:- start:485 stop:1231 length:747 start_codon:yes stop_codon:yes gene_type:complete
MQLAGKKAFVTGGSRGIGREISKALAAEGALVSFTFSSQEDAAAKVVKEITRIGGIAFSHHMDVRKRSCVRDAMASAAERMGGIDVLVNNAGINKPTDLDQITDDDWNEIMAVNLRGPFVCIQEALPYLCKAHNASIINIGSVSGQYGGPRTAHYAASKAGLISLSQVAARFGAEQGIRSNTIAAGLITSNMAEASLSSPTVKKAAEAVLLNRMGSMEEVAHSVVFLASNNSSYITAQTINVNGGLYF